MAVFVLDSCVLKIPGSRSRTKTHLSKSKLITSREELLLFLYVRVYKIGLLLFMYSQCSCSVCTDHVHHMLLLSVHVCCLSLLVDGFRVLEYTPFNDLRLCVSSFRRGHVKIICTVPTLTDDPQRSAALKP